jgi:tRNA (guanine-N(7)-)-methyltransferase subunit TRM82
LIADRQRASCPSSGAIATPLPCLHRSTGAVQLLSSPPAEEGQLSNCIRALEFSPDGKHLLSGGDDKAVRIWSTEDWTCLAALKAPKKVSAAAFTRDSRHALFADKFGDVLVSAVAGLVPGAEAPAPSLLLGHLNAIITSIAVSPDSRLVASTDQDGKARVSVLPQQPLGGSYEVQSYCLGHTSFITSATFVSAPAAAAGCLLVTGAGDGSVRLWEPLSGGCLDVYVASAGQQEEEEQEEEGGREAAEAAEAAEEGAAGEQAAAAAAAQEEEEEEEGGGEGGEDEEQQRRRPPESSACAVLCVAASHDGASVAVAVEGERELLLLSLDQQARKLALAQRLAVPGLAHPCSAAFGAGGRLWVAGGVPVQESGTVHVAVAQRGGEGGYALCTGEVLGAASLAAVECRDPLEEQRLQGEWAPAARSIRTGAGLALPSAGAGSADRASRRCAAPSRACALAAFCLQAPTSPCVHPLAGGQLLSYYSHLKKKRMYTQEERTAFKRARNDHKEAHRLAQLNSKQQGSSAAAS